jgi:hypothetical protein
MYLDNTSVEKYCGAEFGPFGEPLYERGIVSNYIPFRLGCMVCIRIWRQVCIIML